jgi:hypothetical protein
VDRYPICVSYYSVDVDGYRSCGDTHYFLQDDEEQMAEEVMMLIDTDLLTDVYQFEDLRDLAQGLRDAARASWRWAADKDTDGPAWMEAAKGHRYAMLAHAVDTIAYDRLISPDVLAHFVQEENQCHG